MAFSNILNRSTDKPRNFSWFIEDKLAGMAWPPNESFQFLSDKRIKTIINLTEEHPPCYNKVAEEFNIECVHVRVECFGPPQMEQIQEVISVVDNVINTNGGRAAIHCAMGCGRTGTMLACYLMHTEKISGEEAIAETRKRRRGSIENRKQEQAVLDYEQFMKNKAK